MPLARPLVLAVVSVLLVTTTPLFAAVPEGIDPGVWAKVEAQLEAQGVPPMQKAAKSAPTEVAKLLPTPDLSAEGASFGRSIAIDGDTMVVGVVDDDNGPNAGAAYVFNRNQGGTGAWGQVAKLLASDGVIGDAFGSGIGISGDTVVVGANGDDDNGSSSGSAYVFSRDEGGPDAWGEVAKLLPSDGASGDFFGYAVGINGDSVVVGAYNHTENGGQPGSAYVFNRNEAGPDAWGEVTKLLASDGAETYKFGHAVGISGDTVVVGAWGDGDNFNCSGSAYIFNRDEGGPEEWGEVAKLLASDGAAGDYFGYAVGISGDTVVVGAYHNDDNGSSSGSAYVFDRDGGGPEAWGEVAKVLPSNGAASDYFGYAIGISGDTVVVGAWGDGDNGYKSGSAYVFNRDQGGPEAWGEVAKLLPSDGAVSDYFGYAVGISGGTVAAGALNDGDNGYRSGSAYVFSRDQGGANAWGELAKSVAPDALTARADSFGFAVAADRDTVVVGAPGDDDSGRESGAAYIFYRDEGGAEAWGEVAKLLAPDGATYDKFGCAVDISGDTVVIGACEQDDNGWESGAAYVFNRDEGGADAWGGIAKLLAADGADFDYFGSAVGVSAHTVVVGAHGDDDNGPDSGAAYFFNRDEGGIDAWGQVAKILASDGASGDHFGFAVDISGNGVVVGAYGDDDFGLDSGAAYVFNRDEGGTDTWGEVAKLLASDGASSDFFGNSVGISGDTVVVGAHGDDTYGLDSGAAYVFNRNEGGTDTWGEVAKLLASDGASSDFFGNSVGISGDTVVVGAHGDDGYWGSVGSVHVFNRDEGGPDAWGEVAKLLASDGDSPDHFDNPVFGRGLGIGGETVVVGSELRDDVGADSGSAYVFRYSSTHPVVMSVESTPDTVDGVLTAGEWSSSGFTDLRFTFSEPLYDPAGDTDPQDCTNADNWLLVRAGSDGLIQTTSCSASVAGDDLAVPLSEFTTGTTPEFFVEFKTFGGAPLPDERYGVFACGSLRSASGAELDGNEDGVGGDDFVLHFSIDTLPPSNPTLSSPSHTTGQWSSNDSVDLAWSGAVDAGAGVAGYSVVMDTVSNTAPDGAVEVAQAADPHQITEGPLTDGDSWYFHLRTCDQVGNCSAAVHLGPFHIDSTPPGAVTGLGSSSHTTGAPTSDSTIDLYWTAASDNLSGVTGYAVAVTGSASWACDQVQDTSGPAFTSDALADGAWYGHVCAVDAAGNWGAVGTAGPLVVDTTGPAVSSTGSEGGAADGTLDENEGVLAAVTQLWFTFSEPVDLVGAVDPSHYRLVDRGPDGTLSTLSCDAALGGDDIQVALVEGVWVWFDGATVSTFVDSLTGLAPGRYALVVCGLEDSAGNPQAAPWIRRFTVAARNLLHNPSFDSLDSSWEPTSPNAQDIRFDGDDPSSETSGVMVVDPIAGAGERFELSQCLEVFAGTPYVFGGLALVDSAVAGAPSLEAMVRFYRNLGCSDLLETSQATLAAGTTNGAWTPRLLLSARAPEDALSARVGFVVDGGAADQFVITLDEAAFFEDVLFVDGLETGDTGWWSSAVP